MIPYCMEYLSASMLACGSELRFSRRITILAFVLGSASSDSDFGKWKISYCSQKKGMPGRYYLLIIDRSSEHQACRRYQNEDIQGRPRSDHRASLSALT